MKDLLEKLKSANSGGVKMPTFFKDVYSDLRDRHLLPLVAVLLVAIVAVPSLLKASDSDLSPTQAEATLPEAVPASARLEVVADVPALRDYRDRLSDLAAKDPFKQHFTAPQVAGAQLGPTGGISGPTYDVSGSTTSPDLPSPSEVPTYIPPPAPAPAPSPAPDPAPAPAPILPPDGGGGDGGNTNHGPSEVRVETKFVSYRITARVGEPGDMKVRRNIDELTMLPNEKNPIAVFLGVSSDEQKALFLVSTEVTSVFGDAKCRFGDGQCQFIAVEPRFPVTFIYGDNDRKFRLSVNRIERVERSAGSNRSSDTGDPTRVAGSSSVGSADSASGD